MQKREKLFQILVVNKTNLLLGSSVSKDGEDYKKLEKLIRLSTNLSDDQISELLSYEFQALMLLD